MIKSKNYFFTFFKLINYLKQSLFFKYILKTAEHVIFIIPKSPKPIFTNSKQSYKKACVNSRFKTTERVFFLKIENNSQKRVFFFFFMYQQLTLKSLFCIQNKTLFKRSLVFSKSKLPKNVFFELTLQKKIMA